ncbi:MAG: cupredoxin domain-containing protein [Candidatus Eremiobacteraeota bacterium]|nr:cupredoxin domain-containing protein [Candidatus Eremiobacteraeota bacterium]
MFIRTISRWASSLSSAILLFTILAGASANGSSTIQITAVPSSFTPNRIVMHVGQTTTLEFNHTEGVHGIASSDLGIPNTILSADKTNHIEVTPKKAGTFTIRCQTICGDKHADMALTVVVEP